MEKFDLYVKYCLIYTTIILVVNIYMMPLTHLSLI